MATISYKEAPSMYNRNEIVLYEKMMIQINQLAIINQPIPEKVNAQIDSLLFDPSKINDYYLFPEVTTTVMKYYDKFCSTSDKTNNLYRRFEGLFAIKQYIDDMKKLNKPISSQLVAGIGCFHAGGADLPTEISEYREKNYKSVTAPKDGYELYQWVKETFKSIWLETRKRKTPTSTTQNGVRYQVENKVGYQLEKQVKASFTASFMKNASTLLPSFSSKASSVTSFNISVTGSHSQISPHFYENQTNELVNNSTDSVAQGNMLVAKQY
ncbi:hypothetical protein NE237_026394 [Protea cynaroides]|uniref:Uncharacterized protein n=1 Tax=Protea cynaroides TaxID=273540 RepID=A0A9Q0K2P3_9MAGN|nr:hypothetical protein NE237_026394 [Protea cynaroides]